MKCGRGFFSFGLLLLLVLLLSLKNRTKCDRNKIAYSFVAFMIRLQRNKNKWELILNIVYAIFNSLRFYYSSKSCFCGLSVILCRFIAVKCQHTHHIDDQAIRNRVPKKKMFPLLLHFHVSLFQLVNWIISNLV